MFLEISQNSQENTCETSACNFTKKETLAQLFSCEFCEISKNTFFIEHLRVTASGAMVLNIPQDAHISLTTSVGGAAIFNLLLPVFPK